MLECKHGKEMSLCEVCSKNTLVATLMVKVSELEAEVSSLKLEVADLKAQLLAKAVAKDAKKK